jgi:transposase
VLDVQPKLGARVRLLATGASNKNDPNDALSVAVAALRSRTRRQVSADDHATVLKVWSRRHRDLGRAKNQVACRLHAVLCELVPGGVPEEITAAHAARILRSATPSGTAGQARGELAAELLEDMRRLDAQIRDSKKKLATVVKASGTSLTGIFGAGPVIAATVIGDAADVARFATRDRFAAYNGTAPIEVSSGSRKTTGCRCAGTGGSTTPCTWPRSPRSGIPTATAAPITSGRSPRGRPAKRRCAASNGGSATPSTPACRPTPNSPRAL